MQRLFIGMSSNKRPVIGINLSSLFGQARAGQLDMVLSDGKGQHLLAKVDGRPRAHNLFSRVEKPFSRVLREHERSPENHLRHDHQVASPIFSGFEGQA